MNTETKNQRGRPKGAKSLVNITLRQLNELFPQDASVPVGAIWLRDYGVTVKEYAPIVVTTAPPEVEEEPQIQFSVTRPEEMTVDE